MNATDWQALAKLYPALDEAVSTVEAESLAVVDVPTGTTLFREQERCGGLSLLLSGEVRVSRSASSGGLCDPGHILRDPAGARHAPCWASTPVP